MRVLFVSWAWTSHYLPLVPLAWAFRGAGHDVLVATQPGFAPTVTRSGMSAVAVGADMATEELEGRFLRKASPADRPPMEWEELRRYGTRNCELFVTIAGLMLDDLLATAKSWRPDLIVFEPTAYAAPVVAAALGIPAVRHIWGVDYTYYQREFEPQAIAPLCERLGVAGAETLGALTVDPCPPSLQIAPDPRIPVPVERLPMRFMPYNNRRVRPERVVGPRTRPRVLVTWGVSAVLWDPRLDLGNWVATALADLEVEVVLLTATDVDPQLEALPNLRVERNVALNTVLPGCDLIVAQGGLGTLLTALVCGVPQLILPQIGDRVLNARQLAATGAGDFLFATECDAQRLRTRVAGMLDTPSFAQAAAALRDEAQRLPGPAELVPDLVARLAQAGRTSPASAAATTEVFSR